MLRTHDVPVALHVPSLRQLSAAQAVQANAQEAEGAMWAGRLRVLEAWGADGHG